MTAQQSAQVRTRAVCACRLLNPRVSLLLVWSCVPCWLHSITHALSPLLTRTTPSPTAHPMVRNGGRGLALALSCFAACLRCVQRALTVQPLFCMVSLSLSLSSLSVHLSPCDTHLCAPGHVAHEHKSKLMTEEAVPWSTCIAVQLSILLSVEQKHNCSFSQSTQQVAIEARDQTARLAVTNEH